MIFKIVLPENNLEYIGYFMTILRMSGFLPCFKTAEQNAETGQCILTIDAPEQLHQDGIKRIAATAFPQYEIIGA